ncbi:MAG: hypothetical protein WC702_00455 [Patescibacteria group bacterium]|jgi:hypothetical protein
MQEKFSSATPPQESREIKIEQFESAIRKFFREQWPDDPKSKRINYGLGFDISDPKSADMRRVQSGDFEITHFQKLPTSDPKKPSLHFYVGGTEFHISGKAADRIYELMKE